MKNYKPGFVIRKSTMLPQLEQQVHDKTIEALDLFNTDLQIAQYLRQFFESQYRNSVWHCVVGRKFASDITYENGFFIYYYFNAKAFLLFKTTQIILIKFLFFFFAFNNVKISVSILDTYQQFIIFEKYRQQKGNLYSSILKGSRRRIKSTQQGQFTRDITQKNFNRKKLKQ